MQSIIQIIKFDTINRKFSSKELLLLQILAATVFFGRAWQHLFWDVPFRTLLWDEGWITPIVQRFGMTWEDYISNMEIAAWQEIIMQVVGVFYLILGLLVFFANKVSGQAKAKRKWIKSLLWIGSFFLFCLSLLYWKEQFYRIGQLIEYTIQWSTPIFLIVAIYHSSNNFNFRLLIKIAIALTFVGHGLYAFGYYPTPGNFMQMTIDMFAMNDTQASIFLKTVGTLDFVVAVGLFFPKFWKPSIIYCIIWGFATAFARIVANFDVQIPMETLHQWLHETVYRLPHGGLPLLLWLLMQEKL
ncbi:MAG: hypothetical protein AB8G11_22270 [Saprospiraceae bacterium]